MGAQGIKFKPVPSAISCLCVFLSSSSLSTSAQMASHWVYTLQMLTWQPTMDLPSSAQCPWHCHWMKTKRSPPPKLTWHTMVCSKHSQHCHTWPAFILKAQNCTTEVFCPVCPQMPDPKSSLETCHRMREGSAWLIHLQETQCLSENHIESNTSRHHYLHSTHKKT